MKLISVIVLSGLLQLYLPWWSALLPAILIAGWLGNRRSEALWTGALGIGFVWAGYATYLNLMNEGILAGRIAEMFSLPNGWLLVVVTGFIGGITGLMGAWTGYEVHEAWELE